MKLTLSSFLFLALVLALVQSDIVAADSGKKCSAKKHDKSAAVRHHKHHHHHHHHHHKTAKKVASDDEDAPVRTNNDSTDEDDTEDTSSSTKHTYATTHQRGGLTPNGKKAGIAGGDSLNQMKSVIGWLTTWTPNPYPGTKLGDVDFATMMWGIGQSGHDNDAKRFAEFKQVPHGKYKYVIGMNEADFDGEGSSGVIAPEKAAEAWDTYIAPHGRAGSVLISPSCAKQQDENWMKPFLKAVKTQPDVINVHIFKNKASEIDTVLDHFAQYGKPMWITEMACIDYSHGNHAYCSQEQTTEFLNEAVRKLEADDRVAAYAWSDAYNGPSCKLTTGGGHLSTTGKILNRVFSTLSKRSLTKRMQR